MQFRARQCSMQQVGWGLTVGILTLVTGILVVGAAWSLSDPDDHSPGEEAIFGGMTFVWIPAGTFMMGSSESQQDRISNKGHLNRRSHEAPKHRVTLTHGFWMGKYEVTQAQWMDVMGTNPSCFVGDMNRPVEQVSWNDIAQTDGFLDRLNQANPGTTFRLPTEAEWEYACRAGTATRFYWGDDPGYQAIGDYAWFNGNSGNTTHPVGQKMPNAWGLFDMSGNVWEWCQDWYGLYSGSASHDPWKSSVSDSRIPRGGCWVNHGRYCRSTERYGDHPGNRNYGIGLRLCITGSAYL
jgi:formylglycine-generating enzyme required for sulfatase activity